MGSCNRSYLLTPTITEIKISKKIRKLEELSNMQPISMSVKVEVNLFSHNHTAVNQTELTSYN